MRIFSGHQEISMQVDEIIEGKTVCRYDKTFSKELVFRGDDGGYLKLTLVANDVKQLTPSMWIGREEYDKRCTEDDFGKD